MKSGDLYSLYFHIPFCKKKCPYCHFYVTAERQSAKELLLDAFLLEWEQKKPLLQGKKLVSIYFGGGTPFLFGPKALGKILGWIKPEADVEITLEANPEDVTFDAMKALHQVGINRMSIGVQSLDDDLLKLLGRNHSAQKAIDAIEDTARAGIGNISVDLMYDLPSQTFASWQKTLSRLKGLPITHLSLYNLTIEPKTAFFRKKEKLLLPNQEMSLQLLEEALARIEELGLARYEISAFAKPGYASRHNLGYWQGRPFLGLGPSAFSYWGGKRFSNVADLQKYAKRVEGGDSPVDFEEELSPEGKIGELLAIGLRVLSGVDLQRFDSVPIRAIDALCAQGWLQQEKSRLRLTQEGTLFYDSVAEALI
jgi:putative oxygen-independent coproporphyrinogen III oxidase